MTTHQDSPPDVHEDFAPPEAWDAIAASYDEYVAPGEQSVSAAALTLVGLTTGERFLDVAAGPGGLCLAAARLGASTLATDWAPAMVEKFLARAAAEGLEGVDGQVMDAHALDLTDDSFDVVGSQFGVMLVPDQPAALREMVRVSRPGGRALIVAYGDPGSFEALQFFITALQTATDFPGLPDPPPLEFQVSDPTVLRERLTTAGLIVVEVDTSHQERVEFSSGEDLWNWMRGSNPIADMILSEVSDADQQAVRDALEAMIRERAGDTGVAVLTAPLNIGWGRKAG